MERRSNPVVLALPYLPMSEAVTFSGWWLGPVDRFESPWHSSEFEAMARRFLSSFRDTSGSQIQRPSLLARVDGGADGVPPSCDEFRALQLAIGFAAIDQNPYWTEDTQYDVWRVATTDNADLWVQPLNLDEGWIALGRGARVKVTGGRLEAQ